MAFDSARGKVVLFGGDVGGDENDETWEWDGTNWTQLNPVTRPQTREGHAMAYDSDRGRVFLFGGHYNSGVDQYLNDVMEWDGKNWSQKFSVANPSPRAYNALAYDVARGKVLLFGGGHYSGDFRIFDDTWEWDEKKGWMQKTPDVIPVPHSSHALAYDGMRGRVIMFGGARSFSQNDTWEWDGQGNGRPGQVLNVFFKATGVISSTYEPQVKNLNVKFASGGIGYPQGVVTEGVNLMAWYDNEWHTVASNSNGPKAPGLVEWNTTDEKMIWKLLYSGGMNFNFAVVPLAPNGFGHPNCPSDWTAEECDMGMVSTEYVEVTLRYSLP
jgi:hypothetical protein